LHITSNGQEKDEMDLEGREGHCLNNYCLFVKQDAALYNGKGKAAKTAIYQVK
jgi:hypothetical protein